MTFKYIKFIVTSTLLLLTISLSAADEIDLTPMPTSEIIASFENRPLYSSVDEVFSAYHLKFLGALFGKSNLAIMLEPQASSTLVSDVKSLSSTEFEYHVAPFTTAYSAAAFSIIGLVLMVSAILILTSISLFAIERIWGVTTSNKNSGLMNTSGGGLQVAVRVLISAAVIAPAYSSVKNLLEGKTDDVQTPANTLIFKLIGNTIKATEQISRSFSMTEKVYNPFYNVVSPNFHAEQFTAFNDFARCVTNKYGEFHVDLKTGFVGSKSSSGINEYLVYEANHDNCSLRVKIKNDTDTVKALELSDELSKSVGVTAFDFSKAAQDTIKTEFDSYLKTSLIAFQKMTDIYYKGNKEELETHVQVNLENWHSKCDAAFARIRLTKEFGKLVETSHLLPYCYSKKYIEKMSYPTFTSDFDSSVMNEETNSLKEDKTRFVSLCNGFDEETEEAKLVSCAVDKCSGINAKNREGGQGIFECSVAVGAVSEMLGLKAYTSGGFLLAPLYNQNNLNFDIKDGNKNYINSLDVDFDYSQKMDGASSITMGAEGDDLWNHTFKSRGDIVDQSAFSMMYSGSLSGGDSIVSEPNFTSAVERSLFETLNSTTARFHTCFNNVGKLLPQENSACGGNYQETNLFLEGSIKMLAAAWMISVVSPKKIRALGGDKLKKAEDFGKVKATSLLSNPTIKKAMITGLTAAGLGGLTFIVSDDKTFDDLVWFFVGNPDPFSPATESILMNEGGEAALVALVGVISNDTFVSGIIRTLFIASFVAWGVFKHIPALIFLVAMTQAFLNLLMFLITLPFQFSQAYAATGSGGLQKIKKMGVKFLLTLVRFPLVVAGFFMAFKLFDAALPTYIHAISQSAIRFTSDTILSQVIMYLLISLMYGGVILVFAFTCMGTINSLYSHLKAYIVDDSSEQDEDDVMGTYAEAKSLIK